MGKPKRHDASAGTLVVLHGHDSGAKNGDELARQLDPEGHYHHVVPDGPVELDTGNRAWFDAAAAASGDGAVDDAVAMVRTVLASLTAEHALFDGEVVVVGWSQGVAAAVAALATDGAPRVDRVILLSGFAVEAPDLDYDFSLLAGTPVLVQHGSDDDVVPAFFGEGLAMSLRSAGADVTYQTFPVGHSMSPAAIRAATTWLADGRRRQRR